jgi:two-component system LytT family response regulator
MLNMKIRTLIVDDEPLGRSLIRRLLGADPDFEKVGECADGAEALRAIQRDSPDLVFLDVQMPQLSGFELLAKLPKEQLPIVIFVTAFDAFALKAFEAHALDYLLKPLAEDRFFEALNKVKTYIAGRDTRGFRDRLLSLVRELKETTKYLSRFAVESGERFVFLHANEIDWIEAAGNYLKLHVGKQSYLLRGRISEIEKNLSPEQFFRVHRSTIVNLDRVKEFQPLFKGEGLVVLKDGSHLASSRSCSQKLRTFLGARL